MKKLLLSIMSVFLSAAVMADKNGRYFMDVESMSIPENKVEEYFSQWFDLDSENELVKVSEETDMMGMKHASYIQNYNGVTVEHAMILVHSSNGIVKTVNGHIMNSDMHNGLPTKSLRSSNDESVCFVSVKTNDVVRYRPAFKSYSEDGLLTYYVDTETGDTIKTLSNVYSANKSVKVEAATFYDGKQEINCTLEDNGYYVLYDSERNIYTYNATGIDSISRPDRIQDYKDVCTDHFFMYGDEILMSYNDMERAHYLTNVSIFVIAKDWWYNALFDSKPDLYIVVKDDKGKIIYTSGYFNDVEPPVTFDLEKRELDLNLDILFTYTITTHLMTMTMVVLLLLMIWK